MSTEEINENTNDGEKKASEEAYRLSKENFPDIKSNLAYFIQVLSSNTYIYLGMIPIPGTEEVLFDLDQAKQAIDLIEILVNHAKSMVPDEQKREFDNLLSQLQMNYVAKLKSGQETETETDDKPVE
ncbi:DUF1844 domain-containing protein [bacterium]|nr:DUF1844 domain-containing protein [bacterium]